MLVGISVLGIASPRTELITQDFYVTDSHLIGERIRDLYGSSFSNQITPYTNSSIPDSSTLMPLGIGLAVFSRRKR